ncbi:dentin sialophosphoprotein-like [Lytechinus variegatus]|uniref:dentin sialophosphoprotein-like n=1 Tax=Lytechinus variegatus TaxID=7654 RepID=UPI001BB15400|nr:dentin sialophosphoprotein-like [Lytechinus variegatus]
MERVVNARVFEETLTKEQLDDMIKKNIRPDHWEDGIASYFRIQKIIDLLEDERLPLDPHLDTAISVLSDGKAKIRNQSHKKFCRDIRAKVDDLENQSDEDLSQPVECLVPGCFPIGPECESLGIYGDVLCDEEKQFPKPISPSRVTNRLMFELSEYVTRIKETYQNVAGWIKKIMGWGDECALPATLVEEWCNTLTRETMRKKNRSLLVAQKYLLEKFEFPGLVVPSKNKSSEDVDMPTAGLFNGGEMDGKSDTRNTADIENGSSGDHAENDNEDHVNKEIGSEENMDISEDLQEGTEVKKTPSKKLLVTSSSSGNGDSEKAESPTDNGGVDEDTEDGGDKQNDEDNGSTKENGSNEEESDETSPPPRQTSSRSAAKAAIGKIVKPEPKRPSRQATQAAVAASSQKPKRQSAPSRNTRSRAPIKKTPPKVQRSSGSRSRKRKLESSDDASNPDEDDDDDEDENDDDYEDEEEDDDEEDNDESSIEEGEVKILRSRSTRTKAQRSESAKTIMIKKDIAEASKLFTSISKVVHTIKKELKIALDYLESETDKINKNLQKAEKVLDKVIKSVKYENLKDDIEDDDENEDDEEEDNSGEEESEEEMPVRKTRSSPKTKKITVQVKQGVKDKLKKSHVKVERLNSKRVPPSNAVRNTSRKESTPIPKVSRPKRGSTSPRPVLSKDSPKKSSGEIKDFDKEKLFSSRLSVSLTKISQVLVKRALESDRCYEESEIEISPPRQSHSSENSDEDKDADDELDDDHDDEQEVKDVKISKVTRTKSGRFISTKTVPQRSADLRSGKNQPSKKATSESPKDSGNLDGDDSVASKTSRRSPRGRRDDIVKEINNTEEVLSDGEKKRTTRSTRSGKTKEDLPKRVEGSYRSLRERRESPTTDEEVNKPSTMDSPYSGSEDDDDSIPKKSQHTAFATLAAGMTSFGDLRKTTPKEKVKKRSLNDFVKKLNSPKRRKTDSESESSARSKGVKQQPDDSEEDGTEVNEEDDDFLEKRAEKEIEKPNSNGSAELAEESADEQQTVDEKMDETTEEQPEDVDPQTIEAAEHTENPKEVNAEAAQMEKEVDKDDDFPGDAIIGRRIRHRCSLGKHGLYKWYEGKVVHKSTASELLKLDEEQFGHLNNLYTFYTVKYNDNDELQAKALEYDWDRENLKIML